MPATDPISEVLEGDKQLDEFESKYLSKRAGILHVTQFLYNPKDYIYERDEDGNLLPCFPKLKANAEPLLTLERVKEFVQKFDDTKEIAWVLHDKDTYTKSDEKNDDTDRKREGEPKPPHVHILMRSKMKQTPSGSKSRQAIRLYTVSRALGIPMECIEVTKGKIAFPSGLAYLIHRTVQAQALGKHVYDKSEVYANFDWWKIANQYIVKREKALGTDIQFGKWIENLDPEAKDYQLTLWACAVLYDGVTVSTVQERVPLLYEKYSKRFERNRQLYLSRVAKLSPQRLNFLICGNPGTGKTEMAMGLARSLYPNLSDAECFFEIGDRDVRFQHYDGQPVIVWSDVEGASLAAEFDIQSLINLIDTTPHGNMANIKFGEVKLINKVNIFCTTEEYDRFMTGLNLGRMNNIKQVYRRMPFIIPIHADDFDIGISKSFLGESDDFREYEWFKGVSGSAQAMKKFLKDNERAYKYFQAKMVSVIREFAEMALSKRIFNTEGFFGEKQELDEMPPLPPTVDADAIALLSSFGDFIETPEKQKERKPDAINLQRDINFKIKQLENIDMAVKDVKKRIADGDLIKLPENFDEWNQYGAGLRWQGQVPDKLPGLPSIEPVPVDDPF